MFQITILLKIWHWYNFHLLSRKELALYICWAIVLNNIYTFPFTKMKGELLKITQHLRISYLIFGGFDDFVEWGEIRSEYIFYLQFFLYSHIPFSIWDFGFFQGHCVRMIAFICSWIPYFLIQWRCFIFPRGLCLFCVKNTVEHLIVWGHQSLDWPALISCSTCASFPPLPAFHANTAVFLRWPVNQTEAVNRMWIFAFHHLFSTLDPFPCVLHHFGHIYHAAKRCETLFVELEIALVCVFIKKVIATCHNPDLFSQFCVYVSQFLEKSHNCDI